jgi:hypothetical protein
LIHKKLTGISPPVVPDSFSSQVETVFSKAIKIGEQLKGHKKYSRNYYPFYIHRIVEGLTTDEDKELRRILFYIHIQSEDTVISNDHNWEQICAYLPEITYKNTRRNLGTRYIKVD